MSLGVYVCAPNASQSFAMCESKVLIFFQQIFVLRRLHSTQVPLREFRGINFLENTEPGVAEGGGGARARAGGGGGGGAGGGGWESLYYSRQGIQSVNECCTEIPILQL